KHPELQLMSVVRHTAPSTTRGSLLNYRSSWLTCQPIWATLGAMSWEATSVPRSNREAWRWYSTVHARLMRQLARDLGRETGLSEADYQILDALLDMPGCRARALELRCTLQWEKSRLSRQLARMEDRGLLERTPCPVDARGMDIILTAAGREA